MAGAAHEIAICASPGVIDAIEGAPGTECQIAHSVVVAEVGVGRVAPAAYVVAPQAAPAPG